LRRIKVTNACTTEVWGIEVLESLLDVGRRKGAMRPSVDLNSVGRTSAARSLTKEDDEVG
jgi:hypothetical protein